MITENNPSLNSTAEAIFMSTTDRKILEQCRVREDNIAHEKYQNEMIKRLTEEKETWALEKQEFFEAKETWDIEKQELTAENKALQDEIARLKELLKSTESKKG